jgi:DNA polymerase V
MKIAPRWQPTQHVEGRIDLNRDLVKHPLATFYIRVEGDSMEPRIHEGALLIMDRMVEATEGSIVIVRIGTDFMVKKLHLEQDGQIWLLSENEAYLPIQITEDMDFEVWGRVMNAIDFL